MYEIVDWETGELLHTVTTETLKGSDLRAADLVGADLHSADLRHADLTEACLEEADLRKACLEGVILCDANLIMNASLTDANLCAADLTDAWLDARRLMRVLSDDHAHWRDDFDPKAVDEGSRF
jgi:uncharacterized protein YjbI with pentapeptide repeats